MASLRRAAGRCARVDLEGVCARVTHTSLRERSETRAERSQQRERGESERAAVR